MERSVKRLNLGPELRLPDEAQTQTLVVYGGKGMGKTNFAAVFAEELAGARLRFSWIDPVGVAWGLRHSGDGRGAGVEVLILGGIHGDLPIEPTAGAVVADLVVDEDVSVIIDISRKTNGTMWSKADKIRFVRDYCVRLYSRQGERRRPLMQIIDEAGRFVPQMLPKGSSAIDLAECMGAIEELVELGRNVGVGVALITQRSARMAKSVSELAEMMVAFRTVGPNSIAAILDWFGEHVPKERQRALIEQLRELDVGSALIVSPGWLKLEGRYAIRARQTFDSSSTPKAGQERRASGKGAAVNLDKYRDAMAETIERALADDPRELRKQIRDLRQQLSTANTPRARDEAFGKIKADLERQVTELGARATERVEVPALSEKQIARLELLAGGVFDKAASLEDQITALRTISEGIRTDVIDALRNVGTPAPPPARPSLPAAPPRLNTTTRPVAVPEAAASNGASGGENSSVSQPQQKLLDALAWFEAVGVPAPRKAPLAAVAGVSSKSSGFRNNVSRLSAAGLIRYPQPGLVQLTETGREHAQPPVGMGSPEELQEAVCLMVSNPQADLLRVLISSYPAPIDREELAARAGVSVLSSGFRNNVSKLSSLEMLTYPEPGLVRAADLLFLGDAVPA